jgi:hypothetical protein
MESNLFSYREIFSRGWFGLPEKELERLFATSADIVDFFDRVTDVLIGDLPNVVFLEKTPQHILKLPYLAHHFPLSRFIHVIRDGRDCYSSSLSHPNMPQNVSPKAFAQYWRKCILIGKKFHDYHNYYELKYESLCLDAEAEISSLCSWLGLLYDPNMIKVEFIARDSRAKVAHFSRLKEDINSASCGRYKTVMKPGDLQRFLSIAKAELKLCGYESG